MNWLHTVYGEFKNNIPKEMMPEDVRTLYYQETDQIDFNLYNQAQWRPKMWDLLKQSKAFDLKDNLLLADEIIKWRDRTLIWFDQLKKEPKIDPHYFTNSKVSRFVDDTSELLLKYFSEINVELF